MLKDKFVLGVSSLVAMTIIVGAFLSSSRTIATSTSAQATVNVAEACTMSSTLTTPHSATIPNGTYQADIGTTTINVICNDSQGYAIYAVGYTGDEIGGENSTKLVNATGNTNTIATGTATSGNTSNWAMKISTSGSSFVGTIDDSFGNYHAIPNEYTKVAHYNSATDAGNNATGSTYQTTYAAFVSSTQLAGNYAGKVKYTMVHPANEFVPHEVACQAGKICYNPNTNIVEGQMGGQWASNDESVTLWAPNFKKQGYGFAGWSDKYDYETNEDANFYGPNQTVTAPSDIQTKGLSLYAVWVKAHEDMQGWLGCELLRVGEVTALRDSRDNNTYAIAKLADNKCWMIENLRLNDYSILSSSNTNNPLLPIINNYGTNVTSNHLTATSSPSNWCSVYSRDCTEQSRLRTDNTILFMDNIGGSPSSDVYSYGNYYNYYSATAGNGVFYFTESDAEGDICPFGWHLPSGKNTSGDYGRLDSALGGTGAFQTDDIGAVQSKKWRTYPNDFVLSGTITSGTTGGRGSFTSYWTSSADSNLYAYLFGLGNGYVNPGVNSNGRMYGGAIRCIAGT